MSGRTEAVDEVTPSTLEEAAAEVFVRRVQGPWDASDQAALERRLTADPTYAQAYRRIEESWGSLARQAESPELMAYRQQAIAYARRSSARRWLRRGRERFGGWRAAAVAAGVALLAVAGWQASPYGYRPGEYRTGIGEQRLVELEDHSRIALDAATRLTVRYTHDARTVELQGGQAQFSVAKDPARPFKVVAGNRTIIAVGTVFTVEYVDRQVDVAMMEGRVAVAAAPASPRSDPEPVAASPEKGGTIELSAGEELRVGRDGHATVIPHADIEAATAWREGKVIIRTETLGQAVARMNRYSTLQIRIESEALAERRISGVFEAGDTQGFLNAVQRLFPVTVRYSAIDTVQLSAQ